MIEILGETYGPITLEYLNYAMALAVYSVRYPAVFWSCNKALGTIFSLQLLANSAQSLLAYAGMSVLYKVCKIHLAWAHTLLLIGGENKSHKYFISTFTRFTGSSYGTPESATDAKTSHNLDNKHHINFPRGFVLFTESTRHPRSLCPIVSPGTLLQHGDVPLRSRQVRKHNDIVVIIFFVFQNILNNKFLILKCLVSQVFYLLCLVSSNASFLLSQV